MLRFPAPLRVPTGGVAVFADSHLGQAQGDADDFLAALDSVAARGFRTIVLLGDIFHYFIGDRKFETPLVAQVLDAWKKLADEGVSIRYVEGNRDFFIKGTRYASSFSAYGDTDGLEVGGRRYAFVHGDRVNTKDLPYRFWRVASKNPIAHGVMKMLPGALARGIVSRTEARLYQTNFRHKKVLPDAELLAEGRRARRLGYDAVLIGHFHIERVLESPDGVARVLPAWLEERKHLEIAADGTLSIVEEESATRAVRREQGPLAPTDSSA